MVVMDFGYGTPLRARASHEGVRKKPRGRVTRPQQAQGSSQVKAQNRPHFR